jgi:la-related protein 6
VKHVSKDWRVVAYACRQSSKLEVNETGTKVRRIAPLPDTDETSPSRTIVAIGIPADKATIESVAEMFASAGSIALIRILRPGSAVPPDVRQCANRNPEVLTSICAVVEFEMAESARSALREFLDSETRPVVRLVELAARRSNKNTPNSSRPVTPALSSPSSPPSTPPSSPPDSEPNRRKRRGPAKNKAVQNVSAQDNGTWSSSDAEDKSPFNRRKDFYIKPISQTSTPNQSPQQRRHITLANGTNNRTSPRKSLTSSPEMRCRQKSSSYSEPSSPGSHSPWVQRRMAAVSSTPDSTGKGGQANLADNRLSVPTNIVRLPHGPDGTRGFQIHNKPRSASAPEVPRIAMITAF